MSRKTIAVFVAVIGAILGVMASTFELSINATVLAVGIAGVLVWVFGEAKADLAKIGAQIGRFKDPKFLLTMINAIVTALGTAEVIPAVLAESIIAVLTLIIGILFKTDQRLAKT
jgi:hypothetical protein